MEETTFNTFVGIFLIVTGLLFLIFHKRSGKWHTALYYKWYGIEFPVKVFQYISLMAGIIGIVMGIFWAFDLSMNEHILKVIKIIATITVSSIMGGVLLFYHKQLGQSSSDSYYKLFHIRFSAKGFQIVWLIAGLFSIIFGVLIAFHIIL